MSTFRYSRNPILATFRQDLDSFNLWGDALIAAFTVCEAMHVAGLPIPAEWEFSPSPLLAVGDWVHYRENNESQLADDAAENLDALLYAGRVLIKYCAVLRAAGLDY